MRRGLIARSPMELPDAVLDARLERVRAAMRAGAARRARRLYQQHAAGRRVLAHRLRAVLVGSAAGRAARGRAVSRRGAQLPRQNLDRARQPHRRGAAHAAHRAQSGAADRGRRTDAVVGIVDFDGLPAGIADDLREGGPDLALRDASALFAKLRAKADPAEIALATKAAAIAHRALARRRGETSLNAMIAAVEGQAGYLGAEEIYIAAAPDLARDARFVRIEGEPAMGKNFALRATVAYKGTWVRVVRTFCEAAIARQAAARLARSGRAIAGRSRLFRLSAPGWWKAAGWRSRSSR